MKKLLLLLFLIPNLVMAEEKINLSLICEGIRDTYLQGDHLANQEDTQHIAIKNNMLISSFISNMSGGEEYKLTISPDTIKTLKIDTGIKYFSFKLDRYSGKISWLLRNGTSQINFKGLCNKKKNKKF